MNISKPFEDQLIWEFDGIDIPALDFSKYESEVASETISVMSDPIYSKRIKHTKKHLEKYAEYKYIVKQIQEVVEKIKESVSSDSLYVIDRFTNTKTLLYFIDTWNMKEYDLEFIEDKKGFSMDYHIDNRHVKLNLFINLQDNKDSTEFRLLDQYNPVSINSNIERSFRDWKGPTHKGSGYLFFNTSDLWHKINVTEDRYIGMMGVLI